MFSNECHEDERGERGFGPIASPSTRPAGQPGPLVAQAACPQVDTALLTIDEWMSHLNLTQRMELQMSLGDGAAAAVGVAAAIPLGIVQGRLRSQDQQGQPGPLRPQAQDQQGQPGPSRPQ